MMNFGMQYRVRPGDRGEFLRRFHAEIDSLHAAQGKVGIHLWQCFDDPACLLITSDPGDEGALASFLERQELLEIEQPRTTADASRPVGRQAPQALSARRNPPLVNYVEPYYFDHDAA